MDTSENDVREGVVRAPQVLTASVSESAIAVELEDGRSLAVPLAWYPRLMNATESERTTFRIIGRGDGLHWPELDEDVSVAGMLAGHHSMESPQSLERWLANRAAPPDVDG
jgi:hypothetical protein